MATATRPDEIAPQLPQNLDSERSILGAILLDNHSLDIVVEKLKPEDFFLDQNRRIFRNMIAMTEAHVAIDLVTLCEQLHRTGQLEAAGGAGYLAQLVDGVPRIGHTEHYVTIVKEKSLRRQLIHAANAIQQGAFASEDDAATLLERAAATVSAVVAEAQSGCRSWQQKFHVVAELPEGEVSMIINDIVPEGVVFVGASTGVGKTWLALAMARAITRGGKFLGVWTVPEIIPTLYLVPEMSGKSFKRRCQRFGIGGELFRCMTISDGSPCDLSDPVLKAAVRELKPVVILDTAIRFSTGTDENSAAEMAQGLAKAIFALIHVGARAVICLHHRSKDARAAEDLTLENVLRGSGDLAAICDAVWGVQHDRGDGSQAYLKESKNLVRLQVRCVKARDFRPPDDFRVQLDPYIDQIHDMAVLAEDAGPTESEVDRLSDAVAENPRATKIQLQQTTGIGRNRIEKLAAQGGWTYEPKFGWQRTVG